MVPATLKAKEFEELIMDAADREQRAGRLTMGRYGVQGMVVQGRTLLVPSLPDFEGVLATGRQFIIEAKTCSQASFPLSPKTIKPRQVSHMLERSRFGVPCFVLIHFNMRVVRPHPQPGITVALRVDDSNPRWQAFVDESNAAKREKRNMRDQGSISRDLAQDIGQRVRWHIPKGCRKALPDLMSMILPIHLSPEP